MREAGAMHGVDEVGDGLDAPPSRGAVVASEGLDERLATDPLRYEKRTPVPAVAVGKRPRHAETGMSCGGEGIPFALCGRMTNGAIDEIA